jgi:hypothetical protein
MMIKQIEFVFEPEKEKWIKPNPVCFSLETKDGAKVIVEFSYLWENAPHYDLYGEISDTGYRSWFLGHGVIDEKEIIPFAEAALEKCRSKFLEETKNIWVLKKGELYMHWYEGRLTDDYTQTLKLKRKTGKYPGFECVSYYDECINHIRSKMEEMTEMRNRIGREKEAR